MSPPEDGGEEAGRLKTLFEALDLNKGGRIDGEELEAGQIGLKQNLVLYNNFVKEKQGKVADGVSIILIEKKKQKKVCIALHFYTRGPGSTKLL